MKFDILEFFFFRKSVEEFQVSLNQEKNKGYILREYRFIYILREYRFIYILRQYRFIYILREYRFIYIFYHISLTSS